MLTNLNAFVVMHVYIFFTLSPSLDEDYASLSLEPIPKFMINQNWIFLDVLSVLTEENKKSSRMLTIARTHKHVSVLKSDLHLFLAAITNMTMIMFSLLCFQMETNTFESNFSFRFWIL